MASLHVTETERFLIKTNGTKVDLSFFDEVGPMTWGFFYFKIGEKYGFMNELGKVIAGPKYTAAGNFDETGHAAVKTETGWGFIDTHGMEVCRPIYDKVWYYNNGFAKVRKKSQILFIDKIGIEHHTISVKKIWYTVSRR